MKYMLWFSIAAELMLGCIVFTALVATPLEASVKVLIGASVMLFAVVADRASSAAEEQRTMVEMLLADEQARVDIPDSTAIVIVRLAKYTAWVSSGWIIGKLIA